MRLTALTRDPYTTKPVSADDHKTALLKVLLVTDQCNTL